MPRNPPWTRDELILALDLYFRVSPLHVSESHPEIQALSAVLNSLPASASAPDTAKYRNPNGVYMKLCNLLRFDGTYHGKGLTRGGKLERAVWDDYSGDHERLRAVARAIRLSALAHGHAPPVQPAADTDDEIFQEGALLTAMHKRRERNPVLTRRKKRSVLEAAGKLACEACGFDFRATYGDLGDGFAECHHRVALSALPSRRTTRLADLEIVCANCHRMLHRSRPMLFVGALRDLMADRKGHLDST